MVLSTVAQLTATKDFVLVRRPANDVNGWAHKLEWLISSLGAFEQPPVRVTVCQRLLAWHRPS
jgi:hypothetical protein